MDWGTDINGMFDPGMLATMAKITAPKKMKRLLREKIWTTKEHTNIHVTHMDTSHIKSTVLHLLKGTWNLREEWVEVFIKELIDRDEQKLATQLILLK